MSTEPNERERLNSTWREELELYVTFGGPHAMVRISSLKAALAEIERLKDSMAAAENLLTHGIVGYDENVARKILKEALNSKPS